MITVRRANVILTVKDDQVERFIDDGYDVIDETGKVIQKSIPKDLGTLQKAYTELTEEVERLRAENKKLKKDIRQTTIPKRRKRNED